MKIEDIEKALSYAKCVCPPDEYALRQRSLLYAMANFLIEKDNLEGELVDSEDSD